MGLPPFPGGKGLGKAQQDAEKVLLRNTFSLNIQCNPTIPAESLG
jgi:hypothetical protein